MPESKPGDFDSVKENGPHKPVEQRFYDHLSREELIALLERRDRDRARIGLNWSPDHAERDHAFNDDFVTLQLDSSLSDRQAPWENLIIEGDNFDALRWLRMTMRGRIKCIIVDPPYNTGGQSWAYNDRYLDPGEASGFAFTTWLEFLHRRFVVARDLLTEDGVILINISDENRAVLELMLDQTLPGMKIGSLTWRSRTGGNDAEGPFFSSNHEHVLVYGNKAFRFCGSEKTFEMYRFFDQTRNDRFRLDNLTQPKDMWERPNGFYALHDPETDIFYPANPTRVWPSPYAKGDKADRPTNVNPDEEQTKFAVWPPLGSNVESGTDQISKLIADGKIHFPTEQVVKTWHSIEELLQDISNGDVPRSGNTLKLWAGMPAIEFWLGKKVGFGTPAFKRYINDLKNDTQPLSSWITPTSELDTRPTGENSIVSGTTEEGTKALKAVFGTKVFNYPKPLSLIRELLRQSSSPGDTVLDFFAGSATTGQAVMDLNAEDQGDRRFVLVSHDEATEVDRERNICRDVTAQRIRLLNKSATKAEKGAVAPFAYLKTRRVPIDELRDEGALDAGEIWLAAQALHSLPLTPFLPSRSVQFHETDDLRVLYVHDLSVPGAIETLERITRDQRPTHVYTWTPAIARDALFDANAEIHRLPSALSDRFII
jgi:adenine-specific DNA-methyltransferase